MTWLHQRTVESVAYAEEEPQAEAQRQWEAWHSYVTTPPSDYAEFVRMSTRDVEVLATLPPPGWSRDEAAAAKAYMEARARG